MKASVRKRHNDRVARIRAALQTIDELLELNKKGQIAFGTKGARAQLATAMRVLEKVDDGISRELGAVEKWEGSTLEAETVSV